MEEYTLLSKGEIEKRLTSTMSHPPYSETPDTQSFALSTLLQRSIQNKSLIFCKHDVFKKVTFF